MYLLFAIFFISLLGLIILIGRKLVLLRSGVAMPRQNFMPHIEDWKRGAWAILQKTGYSLTVAIVRGYVKLKSVLAKIKSEAAGSLALWQEKRKRGQIQRTEPNKMLKMIAEYKHKVRRIKDKIEREEN